MRDASSKLLVGGASLNPNIVVACSPVSFLIEAFVFSCWCLSISMRSFACFPADIGSKMQVLKSFV